LGLLPDLGLLADFALLPVMGLLADIGLDAGLEAGTETGLLPAIDAGFVAGLVMGLVAGLDADVLGFVKDLAFEPVLGLDPFLLPGLEAGRVVVIYQKQKRIKSRRGNDGTYPSPR
jgi:hypothetical protein